MAGALEVKIRWAEAPNQENGETIPETSAGAPGIRNPVPLVLLDRFEVGVPAVALMEMTEQSRGEERGPIQKMIVVVGMTGRKDHKEKGMLLNTRKQKDLHDRHTTEVAPQDLEGLARGLPVAMLGAGMLRLRTGSSIVQFSSKTSLLPYHHLSI